MKLKILLIFILVIFLVGCTKKSMTSNINTNTETTTKPKSNSMESELYFGEWEIKKILFYGNGGVYSDDDLNKMIGKKLVFSEGKATCFGDSVDYLDKTVKNPKYVEKNTTKEAFLNDYKLPKHNFEFLTSNIIEVNVEESSDTKCHFLIIDKDSLLLIGGGVFLLLNRTANR